MRAKTQEMVDIPKVHTVGKKTDPENQNKGEFIDKEGVGKTALRVGTCKYKSLRKLTDDKPLST